MSKSVKLTGEIDNLTIPLGYRLSGKNRRLQDRQICSSDDLYRFKIK